MDKAIEDYNQAIRLQPDYGAFSTAAWRIATRGNSAQAIADYTETLRLRPGDPDALNNRGNIYFFGGDPDRALVDFNEALRLKPDFALAFCNRGNARMVRGDSDAAISDYTEAIRLKPDFADAICDRGAAYGFSETMGRPLRTQPKPCGSNLITCRRSIIGEIIICSSRTMTGPWLISTRPSASNRKISMPWTAWAPFCG